MTPVKHLDFNTSKDLFRDIIVCNHAKEAVINFYDFDYIEEILASRGIDIKRQEILDCYHQSYKRRKVVEEFNTKYDEQLDELEKDNTLLDGDCLDLYITRVIYELVDHKTVPDLTFVAETIEDYHVGYLGNSMADIADFLSVLNRVKDYHGNDWESFEKYTGCQMNRMLLDIIMCIRCGDDIEMDTYRKFVEEGFKFVANNNIRGNFVMCAGFTEIAVHLGLEELKSYLEKAIALFPNYALYYTANLGISLFENSELFSYSKELLAKSQTMEPKSQDDIDFKEMAKDYLNRKPRFHPGI